MAYVDYYMQSTGNDLNAGSTNADAAVATSTNGDWGNAAANRFTAAAGTPFSGVSVNDWASVYLDAAGSAVYVAQVTAVNGGGASIDLSSTAKIGTAPATGATGRSCKVGGAWASAAVITSLFPSGTISTSTRVNIKAGTYASTTNLRTFGCAGTVTAPIWWRGYKTTIGDQDTNNLAVAGTDIPAFTWTTSGMSVTASNQIFSNLDLASASTTVPTLNVTAGGSTHKFYHVRATATGAAAAARALTAAANTAHYVGCKFTATTSATSAVLVSGNYDKLIGCTVSGGVSNVVISFPGAMLAGCILDSAAGDAVSTSAETTLVNCSIYNPTGHGVNITTTPSNGVTIVNTYFEAVSQASKAAINNTSGTNSTAIACIANGYFNCTANRSGITEDFTIFDVGTLASAAFTSPGAQNFSVGVVAAAKGFPGQFETVSAYQGYLDLGAVQRQASGGAANYAY